MRELLTGAFPDDPVRDMAVSDALLRQVAAGERPPALRLFVPGPTVAFGRLDARLPGFPAAVAAAGDLGFTPVLRIAGGQAAAYDAGSLIVEEVTVAPDPAAGLQERFAAQAELLAGALRGLGLDARIGRLEGEYCPGDFSVHLGGRAKVAGIAQRTIRGGALVSAVVVASSGPRIREAVTAVYAALGRDVDPATAGAVDEVAPDVTPEAVRDALLGAYGPLTERPLDPALLGAAEPLRERHEV